MAAEEGGAVLAAGHVERFNPALMAALQHDIKPRFIEVNRVAVSSVAIDQAVLHAGGFAVDGVAVSPIAPNAMIYIRTHYDTGDEITVDYLRGGEAAKATFKLRAKPW